MWGKLPAEHQNSHLSCFYCCSSYSLIRILLLPVDQISAIPIATNCIAVTVETIYCLLSLIVIVTIALCPPIHLRGESAPHIISNRLCLLQSLDPFFDLFSFLCFSFFFLSFSLSLSFSRPFSSTFLHHPCFDFWVGFNQPRRNRFAIGAR